MEIKKRKQAPISLGGCEQLFKSCKIPFEIYKNWNFGQIFDFAELIHDCTKIKVDETYIEFSKKK